ncbi:sensor histidine kinase [Halobacillus naozhouensis]|uniref:histidine kinase n=1 Tax=Halobacillus naozhouensis TaxID=554880 RepID=A0ABY8J2Z9_9BACI|nr:sensor histidine kinase [Halobacillus naozhouensis]WFT76447.1 sensor histidine kinase [Halobacillus naozhouensis]
MSFLEYVKDKRYFVVLYLLIMSFVSLIMFLGFNQVNPFNKILYTNIICFVIASLYITIGYFYRRMFYQEIKNLIESNQEETMARMPDGQNNEQKLIFNLLKKNHKEHVKHLETLYDQKLDQQEFIISWIHEVKIPIAASRLLMENCEDKTTNFLIDKFEDELHKIDGYIEQALYYSRIDSFSKDYFISEVSTNQLIKNSVKKYAKLFINKGIHFEMDDTEQFVQSDKKWFGFIIDQLFANALKYTDEDGTIAVLFEEDSNEKRLLIQDNGIGIKPEDINRVFEKGFTGATGRNYAKSTGMGLYLAKQLANKLGHNITIGSEENEYTKVTIHFPKIQNYYQL